jgi:hypothetical protein
MNHYHNRLVEPTNVNFLDVSIQTKSRLLSKSFCLSCSSSTCPRLPCYHRLASLSFLQQQCVLIIFRVSSFLLVKPLIRNHTRNPQVTLKRRCPSGSPATMNAKMTNDSPKHHHRPLPQCFQPLKKASSMATLMAKASLVSAWYSRSLAFSAAGMGNGWCERSDANKEVPPCVGASSRGGDARNGACRTLRFRDNCWDGTRPGCVCFASVVAAPREESC